MARIEPPARPPLWVRALSALVRRRYGKAFLPLQLTAHVPGFILPLLMMGRFAHGRGTLSPDTRLLAMLLVAELDVCPWCIDFGRSLAGRALREKAGHVREFETYAGFSEAERAALRYTFEAAQVPVAVSDATFGALRSHYSERQIVELTYAVAFEAFSSRVNAPLGMEAEGFCAIASS